MSRGFAAVSRAMRRLTAPRFVALEGGVFLAPLWRGDPDYPDLRPVQHRENEQNHQHFDFFPGATPRERWEGNLACARAVEACWRAALHGAFPRRAFTLFIANELHELIDDEDRPLGIELIPSLRLWSAGPGEEELLAAFHVRAMESGDALSFLIGPIPTPLSLDEVLRLLDGGPLGA